MSYCEKCTACGEEMCCSPLGCYGSGGKYCEYYLKVLKTSYKEYHKLLEIIFENEDKNKDLISELHKIWEKYDKD